MLDKHWTKTRRLSLIALLAAWHGLSGNAAAAETDTSVDAAKPAGLEEIVVTAQKRSENISNVGMGITAFSGATLEQEGIRTIQDLADIVPGLTYSLTRSNTPVYTLRGVGFNDTTIAAYAPVAVYVDEAPLPFPVLTTAVGLDLERVEVLKGPQGILFGQNATGGALNYIAAKPTDHFSAGIDGSFGRFNDTLINGFVSGPLSDTLRYRVAVQGERADDWQYSYTRDATAGKVQRFAGRVLLEWHALDDLTVNLNLNGWLNRSDPQLAQAIHIAPQIPGAPNVPILLAYPLAPNNNRAADWSPDIPPHANEHMEQATLRADWGFFSGLTLTSITSYVNYRRGSIQDADGITLHDTDFKARAELYSVSQELRVSGATDKPIRWIAGANYEHSSVNEADEYFVGDAGPSELLGFKNDGFFSDQAMNNYAAFANADFDITPMLTFKLGARYTEADRRNTACTVDSGDGELAAVFTGLSRALTRNPNVPAVLPGGCTSLNAVTFIPGVYNASLNEHNVSWRAGVDFKPLPDYLFYANVTKGFKAGSFGTISASTQAQFVPVTQESVLDYEGGFKVKLFDRRVSLEASGFHYDYHNKQVRGDLLDPIFGILEILRNIPKSSIDGADFSVAVAPFEGLSVRASATYLLAKVTSYTGINTVGVVQNFAGAPLPFTPKWEYAVSPDYSWSIGSHWTGSVGATVSFKSRTTGALGSGPVEDIDAYTLLDLRASLATQDGAWRFTLFGNNVADRYYWTNTVHAYDTDVRYTGRPATYGVMASYRYR
jgi:outer membrane receptor protein involved in Fe transport